MGKTALLVVLGTSLVLSSMLVGLNKRSTTQNATISTHYEGIISRNIANSAANIAVTQLFQDFDWRTGVSNTNMSGGDFEVDVQDINFDTTLTLRRVRVTAVSNYAGLSDTVIVVVATPPFSSYASFSSTFPTGISYTTGDTLWGPVHTNGQLGISGSPVFFGKVTMSSSSYKVYGGSPDPKFLGGIEYGVESVPLPDLTSGLQALADSASSGGQIFSAHVWIKFFPATKEYKYKYGGYPPGEITGWDGETFLSDINSVIMSDPNIDIHIKGTLSGQLTIYSGGDIYIEDDVLYDQDPRIYPLSQDVLGLVATDNVILQDNSDTNEDVEIHAAILALNESFKVENYNGRGSLVGTLTTVGSIVQGVISPYRSGSSGYYESSVYDERFLHVGPSVFPMVPKVEVYSWHEDAANNGYGSSVGQTN